MRLHRGSQTCFLLLVYATGQVAAVNLTQCLDTIVQNANVTQDWTGLLNSDGQPISSASDATAMSYSLCASACGTGPETFQWSIFSQEFSAWLLPFLALISQLPFGAQYRLDNLMSAVLTVGSPVLAGYSLFITLLNSCWIYGRFEQSQVDYPNASFALSIMSSLQQVPLRLHFGLADFPSFIILPENDAWWKCFAEFVDFTHTWSIASATSIAWVVVAYFLTVTNSLSEYSNIQSNGESTGSMWLWLIPIVVGWLQLSPKCDFDRLQAAYERAERHGRAASAAAHLGHIPAIKQRALTIIAAEEDVMSPDELLTPPVFNYSRSLRWASTAYTTFLMFNRATEKARSGIPVHGVGWVGSRDLGDIDFRNRLGSPEETAAYCTPPEMGSHWAPGVFTRMTIASCAALALQWGTVGAALIVAWFTPTTRIGCRSMSYLIYGALSTLAWMMFITSSILAHYSAAYPRRMSQSLSARMALALSHGLRRIGYAIAIVNSNVVILASVFQYSSFYDRCYCNSSVFSREGGAYAVIIQSAAQAAQAKSAWIGALALACGSAAGFLILLNLLMDRIL
ncbi:hypothetical protein K503DRAFT_575149 [Rhizopogon vinicolor AM-OR11-026]|uniref:Uncharacterized protein n=1 Tax=Rhizopogon vinicolor AM-OR11-026 TaxID=1314800 RepID=A0A1B7N7E9_9AGAM|nr:hypothetical protein K503DRAFT_575149 [Rhizopogon vinicolor AM-OR11-026]